MARNANAVRNAPKISELDSPVDSATSRLSANRSIRKCRVPYGIPMPLIANVSAASAHSPASCWWSATTAAANDSTIDCAP